ncbi:hypothetical protein KR100_11970 [Synechococcus sp. KORDI-100]|nr:hypothetical protein KR100_11970 [Synechococcus sp. KORDI-100]
MLIGATSHNNILSLTSETFKDKVIFVGFFIVKD